MKKIIFTVFVLSSILFSQTTDTTYINGDSLKTKDVIVVKGWDFHNGDDSTWALPTFNSVGWDTVDSRLNMDSIKAGYWSGIGWFRKTIVIDSSLLYKEIGLILDHYSASELFVNGKKISKYGTVSDSAINEKMYHEDEKPILVRLDSSLTYTIAVKFSNHFALTHNYLYSRNTKIIGFIATIKNWDKGLKKYTNQLSRGNSIGAGLVGIFMSLSVLYFLLFSFYSSQKEYLYYTFFTFSMGIVFLFSLLSNIMHSSYFFYYARPFILPFFLLSIFISVVAFLYKIFYGRMLKIIRYLLIIGILAYISIFFNGMDKIGNFVFLGLMILSSVEILRVIILSIKRKKPNAWVIGAGVGFFAGFIILLFIIGIFWNGNINNLYIIFAFILSIPISMSIYLARSSSQTNENLELQLSNVQKLSDEAIDQEKKAAKLELESQLVKAENDRKSKELEEARQLQLSMLPEELPNLPQLDIAVYMQTATEVGGDYYDFHVGMDGTLTVVIGDATGHGLNAGTIVTATKSLFNSYAANPDILFTFSEISRCIKAMKFRRLSMCLSLLKIEGNNLKMSAAGMPPALIYRKSNNSIEEVMLKGMPLGTTDKFPYELRETQLKSGDTVLLMSDGFPELFNSKKEMYGYDKVKDTFSAIAEKSTENIIEHLKDKVTDWSGGKDPDDDVTFVVLKMK